MVHDKSARGSSFSPKINNMLIPRRITLIIFFFISNIIALALWEKLNNSSIFTWLSSLASPLCVMISTLIWAFREKPDMLFDIDQMDSEEFERIYIKFDKKIRLRSLKLTIKTLIAALFASIPAIATQLGYEHKYWMILVACMSTFYCFYSYLIAQHWDEQIRIYKYEKILEKKQKIEKQQILNELKKNNKHVHENRLAITKMTLTNSDIKTKDFGLSNKDEK